jgi:hypothetical protein|tara:strand:+ start:74 stop:541 length:468 start_codon:yes stop_codon:yes gene_type:complete
MIKFKQKFKLIESGDLSPLDEVLDKLEPKIKEGIDYTLYLLDDKKQRTLNANRYYFGVVLKVISDETGEKNVNIAVDDLHEVLKFKFNSKVILIDGEPHEIGESTKKMTQDRFIEYIEQIREWAFEELNCWIPLPTDVEGADFGDLYIQAYHNHK